MPRDWKKFPELRKGELEIYYFNSPHRQITGDFRAKITKVIDGDTVRILWKERDFDFPVRIIDINAPEMNEPRGKEVREWLEDQIMDEEVDILVDKNRRVGKWGRILGKIQHRGIDVGEQMMRLGMVTSFEGRNEGTIPDFTQELLKVRI